MDRKVNGKDIYIPVQLKGYDYAKNDRLPIIVHASPKATDKIKFNLTDLKLYQADGTTEVVSGQSIPAPQQDTTYYLEGTKAGAGTVDLFLNNVKKDGMIVNEFNWTGPLSVPQFGKYEYAVRGALPAGAAWTNPTGGTKTAHGSVANDVDIQWGPGPAVVDAPFKVNANYTWDLEVNDVQVVVEKPNNANTFTLGTVVDDNKGRDDTLRKRKIKLVTTTGAGGSGDGIQWQAKVTLNGPNNNLGVSHIKVGFVQNLTVTTLTGTYANNAGTFASGMQGKTFWDTQETHDGIFYTIKPTGFFKDATASNNVKTISSVDQPKGGPPLVMASQALTAMGLVWNFNLFVVAETTDTPNNAQNVVAAQSLAKWKFDGSGPIVNGVWSGNANGITQLSDWAALGAASPSPNTTDPRFNDQVNIADFFKQ